MSTRTRFLAVSLVSLCLAAYAAAESPRFATPHARIPKNVDESARVSLRGNVHPMVASTTTSEAADSGTPMEHMILFLKADVTQETQLAQLIAQQNDPKSPLYQHYLSPKDFGAQFGVAQSDIDTVTAWLQSHGFTVTQVPAGNRSVVFSGTAAQVAEAFNTQIRRYAVRGAVHYANASDPQIPAALADSVGGIVKLHDFRHGHSITSAKLVNAAELASPQFTSGANHYLAPADYSTLYDIGPLYSAGINGTGQTIAVIARSNIYMSDVQTFRANFGLKANNPQIVITNGDPGVLQGDSVETTLDTEWSGAVAPNATIKVIVSASTSTADGIDLAALYAVNNNVAPIITLSYGSCEAGMGTSEMAFYNSLWKQAAAQGQSVMVSSGDSGAAGCDYGNVATNGQGINGLCSSPYATCVGGTQFVEGTNPGQYWLPGNNATYGSAVSYIPEAVWNESGSNGGSGLWAGGGGASRTYAKPAWQTGIGVPADGRRDVPDVSLTAAGHDGYLIWLYGQLNSVGGTSAAAPSFAGMMALVNQKTNARQGVVNPILYPLATKQSAGGAAIFHDTKTGNNSVPGATGFSATTGYDLATGLGSVDANLLVNHWTDASTTAASLSLASSVTSLTVKAGQSAPATITSTATGLTAAVTLVVTGAPAGVTTTLSSNSIASPGSGAVTLNVAASLTVVPGTYPLTITGTSGTQTSMVIVSLVIPTPTFTFSPTTSSISIAAGTTGQVSVAVAPQNGFNSAVALSASGLPAGVTVAFAPASLAGASGGSSTISFTVASTVKAASYPVTISAIGGGVTQSAVFTVVVPAPASCLLAANPASITLLVGQTTTASVTCGSITGTFASPLALSVSGAPTGVTAKMSAATVTAGSAAALTISSLTSTTPGSYTLSVTATSGTFTKTLAIPLVVPTPGFTLVTGVSSVSALQGASAQAALTITSQNGFSSAVALSVAGLPSGVTGVFSTATLTTTSSASSTLIMTAAKTVKAGTYPLTVNATGGGLTRTVAVSLTVMASPICSLAATPASVTLNAGQSISVQVSCPVTQGAFTEPLVYSVSGTPSGVTAQIASTGTTSATLNIASTLNASTGTKSLSLSAAGSGFIQTILVPLTINVPSLFTVTESLSALTVKLGSSGQVSATTLRYGSFNSAVSFAISGLPSGVAAALSSSVVAAPGSGTVLATFAVSCAAKEGTYNLILTAIGGGLTQTLPLTLVVAAAQDFAMAVNVAAITAPQGGSAPVIVSTGNFTGGFNSTIVLTINGLPPGGNWSSNGATTGNNMVNISYAFMAGSNTPVGTYPVTVVASGAGIIHSTIVQMTVTAKK